MNKYQKFLYELKKSKGYRFGSSLVSFLFGKNVNSNRHEVVLDEHLPKNEVARFKRPGTSNVSSLNNITSTTFNPVSVTESIAFSEDDIAVVAPGEDPFVSDNVVAQIETAQNLTNMMINRYDKMAIDLLTTGTVKDNDGNALYELGRAADLTKNNVDFSGSNDPFASLGELHELLTGKYRTANSKFVAIMGSSAYSKFMNNQKVKDQIDRRLFVTTGNAEAYNVDGNDLSVSLTIPVHSGTFAGNLDVLGYNQTYTDSNGTEKPFVPENSIILLSAATTQNNVQIYLPTFVPVSFDKLEKVVGRYSFYSKIENDVQFNTIISRPFFALGNSNSVGHLIVA